MNIYCVVANNTYKNILINEETLQFDFEVPEEFANYRALMWNKNHSSSPDGITIFLNDGGKIELEATEENFNTYFKYYVDLWQAEKDRLEQEQADAEYEANRFENRQAKSLVQLNEDFETVKERAHIKSSLGFEVDANQTANENVTGLLVTIGDGETVQFCDYYNQFHELNKVQLQTLQTEIIQNAQNLYAQKWQYRTAIENCTDNDQLDAAVEAINFTYMDFTPPTDEPDGEQTEGQTE